MMSHHAQKSQFWPNKRRISECSCVLNTTNTRVLPPCVFFFVSLQQISGNCNTTILHTPEKYSYLYSYDCTLVPGETSPGLKCGHSARGNVVIQNNCPVWSRRSSGEAPADLPHLPPPAARGQPACREGCRHHAGPLQETVHAERRARSEEDHESCSAGMAEKILF